MTRQLAIATPTRTKEILQKYDFMFKKSLGQNFIVDTNVLLNIVDAAGIDENSNVMEVGPGIGALTEQLARHAHRVLAFEIDQRLLPILDDTLSAYDNVHIHHQDVLKADVSALIDEYLPAEGGVDVVANLPYYVTTPIILGLLKVPRIDSFTIMLQKEVADRISAKPGTKAYGSLSIAIQYYMTAEVALIVPKTVFMSQPNVESAVVHLRRHEQPVAQVDDEEFFFTVTRASFQQRRKTLWNNLTSSYPQLKEQKETFEAELATYDIALIQRGETLSIQDFANLSNILKKYVQNPEN